MADFKDKVAIVTGSSMGLGAEIARKLAAGGAKLVINYSKSQQEAEAVAAECTALGGDAIVVQGNVALDADCKKIAQTTLDQWGRIDILVNNAGTTKFVNHADLDGLSAEDFTQIYQVNVVGPYQMTRAVAPSMKEQKYGAIVNISSIAGVLGIGSSIAYCASKGALNTMTRSLARALAPEIRVNAVCPGFIGTGWFKSRFDEDSFNKIVKQMEATTPLATAGTPDLVSDTVLFFCGDGARHITGETLLSDAGMHLGGF